MAEFTGGLEKYISAREPLIFENKTESKYEVCAGIVFHKSGIYEVSVDGNRTIVSEVPKQKTGKWIEIKYTFHHKCSNCEWINNADSGYNFCPNCGSYNGGEQE